MWYAKQVGARLFLIALAMHATLLGACGKDPTTALLLVKFQVLQGFESATELRVTIDESDEHRVDLSNVDFSKQEIVIGIEGIATKGNARTAKIVAEILDAAACVLAVADPVDVEIQPGSVTETTLSLRTEASHRCASVEAGTDVFAYLADAGAFDSGNVDTANFDASDVDGAAECSAGTFIVAGICQGCGTGTFTNLPGALECKAWTVCPPGTFVEIVGSEISDQKCAPCPDGQYTAGENSSACVDKGTCAPGTEQTAAATDTAPPMCSPCGEGTYCAGGAVSKQACSGENWDHDKNPGSDCRAKSACEPGQYVVNEGDAVSDRRCANCSAGSFSSASNSAMCTGCAMGSYCPSGAASAQNCTGETWDDDGSAATPCAPKKICPNGQYASNNGSSTQDRSCSAWAICVPGQFVATQGSTTSDRVCAPCPAGTSSNATNASECVRPAAGATVVRPLPCVVAVGTPIGVSVKLNSRPTHDVRIPISVSNPSTGTTSLSTLLFTPDNWSNLAWFDIIGLYGGSYGSGAALTVYLGPAVSADSIYNGFIPSEFNCSVRWPPSPDGGSDASTMDSN